MNFQDYDSEEERHSLIKLVQISQTAKKNSRKDEIAKREKTDKNLNILEENQDDQGGWGIQANQSGRRTRRNYQKEIDKRQPNFEFSEKRQENNISRLTRAQSRNQPSPNIKISAEFFQPHGREQVRPINLDISRERELMEVDFIPHFLSSQRTPLFVQPASKLAEPIANQQISIDQRRLPKKCKHLGKMPLYPLMERDLAKWIQNQLRLAGNARFTQSTIRAKALELLRDPHNRQRYEFQDSHGFRGSKGWLQKFLRRHPGIYRQMRRRMDLIGLNKRRLRRFN